MKNGKQLLGLMMVCGALLVGCSQDVEQVEPEQQKVIKEDKTIEEKHLTYNDLINDIEWSMATDEYGDTTVTGLLTNKTDKEIEYIEIEYKFIKDGVTVDSSWTNAINIEPGESVSVEIYTFEEFDTMKVKDSEAKDWITIGTETDTEDVISEEQQGQVVEEQQEKEQADVVIYEYNGTLKEYIADALEAGVTESDVNGIVTQMFEIAMYSSMDNKEHILVDKDGNTIYSYMNGEMVQDNVSAYLGN